MLLQPVSVTITRSPAMLPETVFLKMTRPKSLNWGILSTSKRHSMSPCRSHTYVEPTNSYLWHRAENATEYNQLTFGQLWHDACLANKLTREMRRGDVL
jgi:hypothetical protein